MRRSSFVAATAAVFGGCGAENSIAMFDAEDGAGGAWDTGYSAAPSDEDGDDGADDGYEPEEEDDFAALRPATTPTYVFVANPDRDTVTRIDTTTLAVITTDVGDSPALVQTTPDQSKAVVFNQGSDDLSIVVAATLAVDTVGVRSHFNSMVLSPDGRWAAVFHDRDAEDGAEESGTQSYNEVSLVDLVGLHHYPMVVGYDPHDIQYTGDSATAVVVSDGWLAVIDITAETPEPDRVAITDDLVDPPEAEEVLLTPDGRYAFVRQFGETTLTVVELATGEVSRVEVGANPTDLDVSPDGTEAFAVARGSNEIWIYPLDDPFGEPEVVSFDPGDVYGSITMSPDGSQGILYSTASGRARYGVWDRGAGTVTTRSLVKPVQSVSVNASGTTAVFFHPKDDGEDVEADSPYAGAFALTMVELSGYFGHPLRLADEPMEYAETEDGSYGYYIMAGEPYLEALDLNTLMFDEIELRSEPVHVGALPDSLTAYASQSYESGRISFYDPQTGDLRTITGFELNAGIEQQLGRDTEVAAPRPPGRTTERQLTG